LAAGKMVDDRGAVFALLDDCDATAARRSSRLYTQFLHERVCADAAQLDAVCEAVAGDLRNGLHAVVLGDYEFGRQLVLERGVGASPLRTSQGSELQPSGQQSLQLDKAQRGDATLRFLLFEQCARLSRDEVDAWLTERDGGAAQPSVAGTAGVRASVDPAQFDAAIGAIHDALRIGDTYQVNYTYRLAFDVFGTPAALYRRLRARQPVPYGALIALPGDRWVLSCSPELFVEKAGTTLRARPMKGTAPRAPDDPIADCHAAEFLANDPKNRAENVMIVDLLRNDLSRVAETGSVKVPALFSVEPYASVWQMTSTVEARLRARTSFVDVLRALFPCGSITGAPKHRTMQLIESLESTPRGLYTGAIGWLDAGEIGNAAAAFAPIAASATSATLVATAASTTSDVTAAPGATESSPASDSLDPAHDACGDFCLSVAIRTLTLDAPGSGADVRRGSMGVGAGIVLDSVPADEYAECQLKARFLTDADPGFELFETMYATREAGVRHLARHLGRLAASAAWLGFRFDETALRARIDVQCDSLPAQTPHRVRLALAKSGAVQISAAQLTPLQDGEVGLLLAPDHGFAATEAGDALLHHKTTRRAEYDRGWRSAEALGAFDTLFFNERGELTEGGRSNVFVKLAGRWWTPPLSSGMLPGVMRGVLLEDAELRAAERVLTRADVLHAEAILVCNALRGALPARLIG
jgi:para-aminobenzoate synthetase/4-amino-4-deoxychorismate lyase